MPPLTAEPLVLVFHSTNKISGAKVNKYTTASQKGLSVYEEIRAPTPAIAGARSPSSRGTPTAGPSSKRQRLQADHITPGSGGFHGTLAPPKRKRKPVRKIDLNRDLYFEDGITSLQEPEWPSDSEAELSDTSSLTPPPPSPKAMSPARDAASPEDLEYGRHFTSYYILDDDDDDKGKKPATAPPVKATKPAKKPDAPRPHPQPQPYRGPYPPPPQAHHPSRAPRQRQPTSRPIPVPPPLPVLPILPPPRVTIIDNIKRNANPDKQYTLDEMILKLEVLSLALVKFGAVPPAKEPPVQAPPPPQNPSVANSVNGGPSRSAAKSQADESVNGLLAMFDDDDDDSDAADEDGGVDAASPQSSKDADDGLWVPGTADADLNYGIQFIMNALMTWAKQRIDAMYTQQWQQYNDVAQQSQAQQHLQPKKSRGRPRANDANPAQAYAPHPPPPPSVVNAELTNTPEGEAVQAFQDVVDCGVLKVNGVMPKGLTQALGVLYVQIDHLINNSARDTPRWQCMSYQAQIKAHNIKVQRWKEQAVKMQEEMSRQQDLAHQQMTMQMSAHRHSQHRQSMGHEQTSRHGGHHAQSTRNVTTPMDLDDRRRSAPGPSTAASPANGGASNTARPSPHHPANVPVQNSESRVHDAMSRVTMYHDGRPANVAPEHQAQLQMRSGHAMKFSFDHSNNEAARQLFGPSAFPSTGDQTSNIPRRGPMVGRPTEHPNGRMPTPVLGSNAPPLNGVAKAGEQNGAKSPSDDISITKVNGIKSAPSRTNGEASQPRKSSDLSASSIQSPDVNGRKRKHSEAGLASASASPATAPSNASKHTLRLGRTRKSTAHAASPVDDAVIVDD